jgi:hypothetical protein
MSRTSRWKPPTEPWVTYVGGAIIVITVALGFAGYKEFAAYFCVALLLVIGWVHDSRYGRRRRAALSNLRDRAPDLLREARAKELRRIEAEFGPHPQVRRARTEFERSADDATRS